MYLVGIIKTFSALAVSDIFSCESIPFYSLVFVPTIKQEIVKLEGIHLADAFVFNNMQML